MTIAKLFTYSGVSLVKQSTVQTAATFSSADVQIVTAGDRDCFIRVDSNVYERNQLKGALGR
jgi:hypothetical protein